MTMPGQRVPALGAGRAAEFAAARQDSVERRAQENARALDGLEAMPAKQFTDYERFAVDAILARPLSTSNRERAEALKAKHGMPKVQRPLLAGVAGGQQQGQGHQQGGKDDATQKLYEQGQQIADAIRDAFDR